MTVEYAVYKGEEFLDQGTVYYLANKFNVKQRTIRFWSTPTCKKRNKGKRKIAVKIND